MDTCSKCKKPTLVFPVTKRGFTSKMCQNCYDWQKVWNSKKFNETKQRRESIPEGMKFCMICRLPKPIAEFTVSACHHRKIASGATQAKACISCRQIRATERTAKRHEAFKDPAVRISSLTKRRECARVTRTKLLEKYGAVCVCCGETEPKFLEIDHVNNDGAAHRKKIGVSSEALYRWAEKHGFPPSLQVLCANCHNAKSFWGTCPHQEFSVMSLVEKSA